MEFKVVKSIEEFVKLRQEWDDLSARNGERNFYLTYDWFYCVLTLSQDFSSDIYTIIVQKGKELIGIIPCCIRRRRFRLFDHRSLEIVGNIYSPYRGGVILKGWEVEVAHGLWKFLTTDFSRYWDLLVFEDLSPKDAFVQSLVAVVKEKRLRNWQSEQYVNVVTDLSHVSDSEEYFKKLSKSHRQNIRTGFNRMVREGEIEILAIGGGQESLDIGLRHYHEVYEKSWKEDELDQNFHPGLAKYTMEKNWLRLFILYFRPIKGRDFGIGSDGRFQSYSVSPLNRDVTTDEYIPIAANLFLAYENHAYYLKTAYLQDFAKYSAGTVLFWYSAKYLIDRDKCSDIDHQKGDETYKLKWGEVNETRFRFVVANPESIRGNIEVFSEVCAIPVLRDLRKKLRVAKTAPTSVELRSGSGLN